MVSGSSSVGCVTGLNATGICNKFFMKSRQGSTWADAKIYINWPPPVFQSLALGLGLVEGGLRYHQPGRLYQQHYLNDSSNLARDDKHLPPLALFTIEACLKTRTIIVSGDWQIVADEDVACSTK
ncbi:hypothetical protein ColTof4_09295 [Colletotrichum tofieldiae]|nr:hypothetical protein ColTof3_12578 [Colletotrichum tofieldiae]GKT76872.1 hypothetical protein ColTof4_09295 [Colletotrichum tofieldiae]GKT92683.1 hypothetical protein Ct61P_10533 [Colletotrichum tofieldiae]